MNIVDKVKTSASSIIEITDMLVAVSCADLDDYVKVIDSMLRSTTPPTDRELEEAVVNLTTLLYFSVDQLERLGVEADVSSAMYKEVYNKVRESIESGTIHDKNTRAELATQTEEIISKAYQRAYKRAKSKIDAANEIVTSIKKIISSRCIDKELTLRGKHNSVT